MQLGWEPTRGQSSGQTGLSRPFESHLRQYEHGRHGIVAVIFACQSCSRKTLKGHALLPCHSKFLVPMHPSCKNMSRILCRSLATKCLCKRARRGHWRLFSDRFKFQPFTFNQGMFADLEGVYHYPFRTRCQHPLDLQCHGRLDMTHANHSSRRAS